MCRLLKNRREWIPSLWINDMSVHNSTPALSDHALHRCWKLREFFGRPVGACNQIAAAVRAHTSQDSVTAISAERALKSADHCIRGLRGKVLITAFATRPEFQHIKHPSAGFRPRTGQRSFWHATPEASFQQSAGKHARDAIGRPDHNAGRFERWAISSSVEEFLHVQSLKS